jgi:hypothetical protein
MRGNLSVRYQERGVTLALMALMLFLMLGMSALVIDYGMIKATKAEAQRAMDAAALAGASAFLIADPDVDKGAIAVARARDYAKKHSVHQVQITDPEVEVQVALPDTVTASYTGGATSLWFAQTFGIGSMVIKATASAHVIETGVASCLRPVAIPDMWNNGAHLVTPKGGGKNPPAVESEDLNGDHVWDFVDADGNGAWDDGETEPWQFDPGTDTYDPATNGYGTTFRDTYGAGTTVKTKDYGRQIILMTLSPKDDAVASYYYAWGHNTDETSAEAMAARIVNPSCAPSELATEYPSVRGANGGKLGPISDAWETLIGRDGSAHWDDGSNTVVGSDAGTNWLGQSDRVIVVGLYDPSTILRPNQNTIEFTNFAKVWLDQRPCGGPPGQCKSPITGRFLGYVNGEGGPGPGGTLVKRLVLIK